MNAVALEEHVLRSAKTNAFRTEGACRTGIGRRIGIGAHRHTASAVGPHHQLAEVTRKLGLCHRHLAFQHAAGRAIDGNDIATLQHAANADQNSVAHIDAHRACTGDTGDAHATRHNGGVAGHSTTRGQNAFSGVHTVNVFGAGFDAHQNDAPTFRFCGNGLFCRKDNLTRCSTG